MTGRAGVPVGSKVPEVTLPTLDGQPINLSSLLGRKVVLFMWASW